MDRHVWIHDLMERSAPEIANHTTNGAEHELGSLIKRRERPHEPEV